MVKKRRVEYPAVHFLTPKIEFEETSSTKNGTVFASAEFRNPENGTVFAPAEFRNPENGTVFAPAEFCNPENATIFAPAGSCNCKTEAKNYSKALFLTK